MLHTCKSKWIQACETYGLLIQREKVNRKSNQCKYVDSTDHVLEVLSGLWFVCVL